MSVGWVLHLWRNPVVRNPEIQCLTGRIMRAYIKKSLLLLASATMASPLSCMEGLNLDPLDSGGQRGALQGWEPTGASGPPTKEAPPAPEPRRGRPWRGTVVRYTPYRRVTPGDWYRERLPRIIKEAECFGDIMFQLADQAHIPPLPGVLCACRYTSRCSNLTANTARVRLQMATRYVTTCAERFYAICEDEDCAHELHDGLGIPDDLPRWSVCMRIREALYVRVRPKNIGGLTKKQKIQSIIAMLRGDQPLIQVSKLQPPQTVDVGTAVLSGLYPL
jgi:hypothetical protein